MRLKDDDIVCCPPPLFHCFGLVMGFLASFCHGSSIVFPAEQFEPNLTLNAVAELNVTALLGVPTMFVAILEANEKKRLTINTLRTGLAAGSPVPAALMNQLREKMGVQAMLIAYGMTETSPVTFITSFEDSQEIRATTLGRVMPHTGAKIISKDGKGTILRRGETGELCTSGYALQKGYWKSEAKTTEVMKVDEQGTVWMHTGDECKIDEQGYCWITGRIKDVIIRGGENIFPIEIEERLLAHTAISEASVVGLRDDRYGEVVSCFLRFSEHCSRPEDEELRRWVRQALARHKAPKYVFWIGNEGVGNDFPKTGSGKHQKHLLRDIGNALVKEMAPRARL
jgi:acyl-CoA synthetase (AMP-forming)/AMP-acid ligase II